MERKEYRLPFHCMIATRYRLVFHFSYTVQPYSQPSALQ